MKNTMKIARAIAIFILTISFFGCNNDDNVLPQLTAGYTFTMIEDAGVVSFINTSDNAIKYVWDFGDGTTSTEINPIKDFASGTYNVVLTATNAAGASDSFESEIVILRRGPSSLPLNFDEAQITYNFAVFNGVSFEIVDNPSLSGTNTVASKVGAITNIGAQYEGLTFPLANSIDLTADKSIKIDVWSDKVVDVLVKLENGTAGDIESVVSHGGTGWETLTFDYSSSASYSSVTIFIDGPGSTAGTFYIDNVVQIQTPAPPAPTCTDTNLALPITFDCSSLNYESKRIAGGIDFSIIDNPQLNGVNATATKVGKIINKGDNWENLNFKLDTPVNFATNKSIKIKLYSTVSVPIKLKVETGGTPVEDDQTHGGTGWEELTFTLNTSGSFSNMIIFIDGPGNTAGTFYIDDIMQTETPAPTCTDTNLALPITFDCSSLNYESKRIAGGIDFSIIDNPQLNGVNATATKVGKIINKGDNWENLNFKLDTPVNFATNKSIKIKLYSTVSVPIKLKVETGGTPVEDDQTHGGTGWEELTFTLNTSGSFSNMIIFIDGPGNTAGTFYIDDIKQVASGNVGGSCPTPATGQFVTDGGFETNAGCWELINNGGEVTISTTINNGGSNSGQIKTAPLKNPALKQTRFGVGLIRPNTAYRVTFDIKVNANDLMADGAVFQAFTFSESAEGSNLGATQHILVQGDGNVSTTWQTRTYTFTTAANVDGGLSLLLELVCGGAGTCKGTVNIDNVSITLAP
jgi:hypothetical protein